MHQIPPKYHKYPCSTLSGSLSLSPWPPPVWEARLGQGEEEDYSSSYSSSPMFWTTFVLSFALLLSLPLLFLLAPHFLPPTSRVPIPAIDEIDDQALFARAVRSKSASTPSLYNIYVHTDPFINVTIPPGVFRHRFIASNYSLQS